MDRTIVSSRLTALYKYVFPVAVCGLMIGALLERQFVALACLAVLASMSLTLSFRVKSIEVDDRLIYIRGARRATVERLDSSVAVDEQWLVAPSWARITFKEPTAFGRSVAFIPRGIPIPLFRESEGVAELRRRAGL
jgi:hypothetical protein